MVTTSKKLNPDLRVLKVVLKRYKFNLDVRWIPSAENRREYGLLRTWDPGEPQCTRAVKTLLTASLSSISRKGTVYRYPLTGGNHSVAQRKQAEPALKV